MRIYGGTDYMLKMEENDYGKRKYQIVPLPKEKWEGTVIPMRYTTSEYFDVEEEG